MYIYIIVCVCVYSYVCVYIRCVYLSIFLPITFCLSPTLSWITERAEQERAGRHRRLSGDRPASGHHGGGGSDAYLPTALHLSAGSLR